MPFWSPIFANLRKVLTSSSGDHSRILPITYAPRNYLTISTLKRCVRDEWARGFSLRRYFI